MRKTALMLVFALIFMFFLSSWILADEKEDFQAIKKAVKENPQFKPGVEVKWFKVLVRDTKTKSDKIKITLPISLVEFFFKNSHSRHLKVDCDEFDFDLKELFAELKKLGPMALIEVTEGNEMIKVWLE